MPVEITPTSTRGSKLPRAAIAMMGVMPGLNRLLGGRAMGDCEKKTDGEIPVIRLTPVE